MAGSQNRAGERPCGKAPDWLRGDQQTEDSQGAARGSDTPMGASTRYG